ncbi:MAG: hypothetical protein BWY52_01558 [Chloroflexi bacterium ADurb.Bin325]|nr:MAG: hypothetical protein BWY52_01558 [Chloroflexi bacterium ADurb.Bin325]
MRSVRRPTAPCTRSPRGRGLPSCIVGRSCAILLLLALCLTPAPLAGAPAHVAAAPLIRISQVYGGGGLANAPYQKDFVELHNAGQTAVDVSGWSIQYFKNNQTGPAIRIDLSGVIPAGGYYLAAGYSAKGCNFQKDPCGAPLPAADAANPNLDLANTNAMVYLVNHQETLQTRCAVNIEPLDMVGYGANANCYEGSGPAPGAATTTAVTRKDDGCLDTDQNNADFTTGVPFPRNSATEAFVCLPQAVTLAGWEARAVGSVVQLAWETVSETANAGFNLYRGPAAAGPWARLNPELIPARTPGATDGGQYAWTDTTVEIGATYWYLLEDVALDGALTRHDPVTATVARPNAVGLAGSRALQGDSLPFWLLVTGALGLAAVGFGLLHRAGRRA